MAGFYAARDSLIRAAVASRLLTADLDTGEVLRDGEPCGYLHASGYVQVPLPGAGAVNAHRVVWLIATGELDSYRHINHRNRNRSDNRPANLEQVTAQENAAHRVGSYRYQGVRPEDVEEVWQDNPEWLAKVVELAGRGEGVTPEEVAALRSEALCPPGPLADIDHAEKRRHWRRGVDQVITRSASPRGSGSRPPRTAPDHLQHYNRSPQETGR